MATSVLKLISDAKILSGDPDGVRTAEAEWLSWLSEAERVICEISPSAYMVVGNVDLVAGTEQSLPAAGRVFSDYVCHMGSDGNTPGQAATKIERWRLDRVRPSWHAYRQSAAPEHFIFDEDHPTKFWVYPPNTGSTKAKIKYASTPPEITSAGANINLPDRYATPILNWMLHRCFQKDNEAPANAARSIYYQGLFNATFGAKDRAESLIAPD